MPALRFLGLAALLAPMAIAQTPDPIAKLTADDASRNDNFGHAVTVAGETAVATGHGADDVAGAAWVFRADAGGPDAWGQVAKLTDDDRQSFDNFGFSAASSGDTVVVGARSDRIAGVRTGSAFLFERDAGGPDAWGQVARLVADDGEAFDEIGYSVAIDGDTVVVGARGDDDGGSFAGAAYLFERDFGGPGAWGQVVKLVAEDAAPQAVFGGSAAIDGDTVAVGALGDANAGFTTGAVYLFERDAGGPGAWGQVIKLTAGDATADDRFGSAVALEGDRLIVGAVGDDDHGSSSGSAYLFERDAGGPGAWGQVMKITAADGADNDQLGISVALAGDLAAVGAFLDDDGGPDSGSVYLFSRDAGAPGAWGQVAKVTAGDAAAGDWFGWSLAMDGSLLVIGAREDDDDGPSSGSAYVFRLAVPCVDDDGDGYGAPGNAECPAGPETDCDDAEPTVHPGAVEACDGLDTDCNGLVDDATLLIVEAFRHVVGAQGGSQSVPLDGLPVAVFDKAPGSCPRTVCGGVSWQHYPCVVAQCPAVAAGVTDLGGEARLALPAGDYLVIGGDGTDKHLGVSASDVACGEVVRKHLQQLD